MGQTLLLSRWQPLFDWLPVETLIRECHQEYYILLAVADKAADSTAFVEFMLRVIRDAFNDLMQTEQVRGQVTDQVAHRMSALGSETLSAKELLERLGLKHRPTFSNNYLRPALELGSIEMTVPDKPNSSKQQYRAVKTNEFREEMRNSLRSSIWKFLDGRWQIVFHQGTKTTGQPVTSTKNN